MFVNLTPEQLRVSVDEKLAVSEQTEPMFAPAAILQTHAATAAAGMKGKFPRFPKEWTNLKLDREDKDLVTAIREKRLKREDTDVMCLVLQPGKDIITDVRVDFKRVVLKGFTEIYDDDDVLDIASDEDPEESQAAAFNKRAKETVVRTISKVDAGNTLLCPLYICEFAESTKPDRESGYPQKWRLAKGEVWIPQTVRFIDISGRERSISVNKVSQRYTSHPESENTFAAAKTTLDNIASNPPPNPPPLTGSPGGVAPGSKWLVTYFSFNDVVEVGKDRKAQRENDAFLEFPWMSTKVMMPEVRKPPGVDEVPFANDAEKQRYQHTLSSGGLRVPSAEIMSLSLRLSGSAATDACVKVKRVKLIKPFQLFRKDKTLIAEQYDALLRMAESESDEIIAIGAVDSGKGVNIPLFVVEDVTGGETVADHEKIGTWRLIFNEIILPVSVLQVEGDRVYETPIRRMKAQPWRISTNLFGRG